MLTVRKRRRLYSLDVKCPKCQGDVVKEAESGDRKYSKSFALRCSDCNTLFSLNIFLRSEISRTGPRL